MSDSIACGNDMTASARLVSGRLMAFVFSLGLLVLAMAADPARAAEPLDLSDDERAFIAAQNAISIGLVADNEPYSFHLNGKTMGWSVDVIDAISELTGLKFEKRLGSWPEIFGQFRRGRLDVIADISYTEARSAFIGFTGPYHLRRTVLFENIDRPIYNAADVGSLKSKRIGVIRDIYYAGALEQAGFQLQEYATYRDLMAAVAFGWVDGALAAELTGNFFVRENGFTNVVSAGALPLTEVSLEDFRLGVLDEPGSDKNAATLLSILRKAVLALPAETLDEITERWLAYRANRAVNAPPLRLLPEEQAFIENAPPLKVGFIIDYQPFSFLENGRGHGLAVDLTQYIASNTGLVFEPVFANWADLLQRFRTGEIDVITNISRTDERAAYTLFSEEYHRIPNAVFVRSGFGPYRGPEDIEDKIIGIGNDIYYADAVKERFAEVREFDGQQALMIALANGEIDVAIAALSNGNAIIRANDLINIEIGGEFRLEGVEREDLRFGISPEYPYLQSIINRSLTSIPLSRWQEMETRWLGPPLARIDRGRVMLDDNEHAYLEDQAPLRVCIEPTAPPYTMIEQNGDFTGAIAEIIALLAERADFSWEIQAMPTGSGDGQPADLTGCDVLPFVIKSAFAQEMFELAPSYLELALAVASPLQAPFVESMRDLSGQRVGVVPNHVPLALLRSRYPDVAIASLANEAEGLEAVLDGSLDAVVGPLDILAFQIAGMRTNYVKISGRIAENVQVVAATPADDPLLGDIFEKLLATLDPAEIDRILGRQTLAPFKRAVDYRVLFASAGLVACLFVIVLYWLRKLRLLNRALNRANHLLRQSAITDGMTGLYNRTYFISRAQAAFDQCRREQRHFTLTMLDVDNFKPVNDRLGHVFGDACLRHLADILRGHFQRSGDLIARYGGEEFIAFQTSSGGGDTRLFLEALRQKIESRPVAHPDGPVTLTVSIGFHCAVPGHNDTLDRFIADADANLYMAKDDGRNRIVGDV